MDTPVAFFIYNRPRVTARVFEAIRQAQPPTLLLVADGPRTDHPDETTRCAETRAVVEQIDWACDVRRNYADCNLGCKQRVASGLDWVFEQVEEAIILEDDCLPHPSFFPYCKALLGQYRNDMRVMHINGNNYGIDQRSIHPYAYSFCQFPQVWGWATWRRAWRYFDVSMTTWPTFRDSGFIDKLPLNTTLSKRQRQRWENAYRSRIDTWDFQWHFAVMSQHGLAVTPRHNLISNIGFTPDATHTQDPQSTRANLPTHPMALPLQHPPFVCTHPAIDEIYAMMMLGDSTLDRILRKIQRVLRFGASAP